MGKENQYLEQLDKEIKALGIGEQILFTGWISGDTLKACYASADVVVVPSIYLDPFPTITLEAMASGKAVVVTCHGGTRELVVDGVTGYVINPHDIESFSQAVVKVLNDTICARTMGEAGKKRIQELFSLQKQTEKIVSWYYK